MLKDMGVGVHTQGNSEGRVATGLGWCCRNINGKEKGGLSLRAPLEE